MPFLKVQQNRVLINSLPKSGTHLLTKTIDIFGYKEYATNRNYIKRLIDSLGFSTPKYFIYREAKKALKKGKQTQNSIVEKIGIGAFSPYYVNQPTVRYWLNTIHRGQYIQGHIPWTPALVPVITDLDYHLMVIIRDPRAVVASLIPFVLNARKTGMGAHFLEADFKPMSPMQRLNFILEGGYAPKAGIEIKSFADVYRSMLAWHNKPGCLFLHFEDLVGEQGGGSIEKQRRVVESIASFLGIQFNNEIYARLKDIYDPSARTFRIGKIDGWKNSMDSKSIERLNESCEALCNEAGYRLT